MEIKFHLPDWEVIDFRTPIKEEMYWNGISVVPASGRVKEGYYLILQKKRNLLEEISRASWISYAVLLFDVYDREQLSKISLTEYSYKEFRPPKKGDFYLSDLQYSIETASFNFSNASPRIILKKLDKGHSEGLYL